MRGDRAPQVLEIGMKFSAAEAMAFTDETKRRM